MLARTSYTYKTEKENATVRTFKRAILYARNSDPDYELNKGKESVRLKVLGGSTETTVEQQIEEGTALIRELGSTLAPEDIHIEYMTGVDSLFDRPEVNTVREKIRRAAETNEKYDLFVCYDTDRLARDPIETGLVLKECMKYGCELQFVRMPLENSEVGMILLFMRGYGDRMEATKFQDRIRRHREACVRNKRTPAAQRPPLGYFNNFVLDEATGRKVFTGTRALEEQASKLVLKMFELVGYEDLSATQVAIRLDREKQSSPAAHRGYRYRIGSAENCRWTSGRAAKILRDPTYTGKTFINQYRPTGKKSAKGKRLQERKPVSEWTLLTDDEKVTPRIVSDELFALVQQKLDANRNKEYTTRNTRHPVLLRGLVFCAECGNKMYSTTHHRKNPIFRCSSKSLKNGFRCPGTQVNRAELEEKVWAKVVEFYQAPEIVEHEVRAILNGMDTRQIEIDLQIAQEEVEKRKEYLNDLVERMMKASRAGRTLIADKLDGECLIVEDEIKRLEKMINEMRSKITAKNYVVQIAQQFKELCQAYKAGFSEEIPFERKRDALTALRVKVLASSKRRPVLQTHLGVLLEIAQETSGVVSHPAIAARASRPRL